MSVHARTSSGVALSAGAVMLAATVALAAVAQLTSPDAFALPFVASACVIAMVPQAPRARPAALLLGYGTSTVIATATTTLIRPSTWTAIAAAVAVASTVAMLLLKAPHPPAAVAAALIGLHGAGRGYLPLAVLPAVAIILAVALLAGRGLPTYR